MYIRRVSTPKELTECVKLRRRVFIEEQGVPESKEMDGLDMECRHFIAVPEQKSKEDEAMGTARLMLLPDGEARIQRVAVLPAYRKHGVGRALMFALEGEAARAGYDTVILNSQVTAIPFYEKIGYKGVGANFMEAGIEHRTM